MKKATILKMIEREMSEITDRRDVFQGRLPNLDRDTLEWTVNCNAAREASGKLITLGRLRYAVKAHDENEIRIGV